MEEIIPKRPVPAMLEDIWVRYANEEFNTSEETEITDISRAGVEKIVEKVRNGTYGACSSARMTAGRRGFS